MNYKVYFQIMPKAGYIYIIVLLFSFSITAQTEINDGQNPAMVVSKDPTVANWQKQARSYLLASDWKKTIETYQQISRYYVNSKDKNAWFYLQKAQQLSQTHLPSKMAGIYSDFSYAYGTFGQQIKAVDYSIRAVRAAEQYRLKGRELGDIYNKAAISYSQTMQYDTAIEYSKKAIAAAEQTQDINLILSSYFNLAVTLPDLKREKEALDLLDTMLKKYPANDEEYQFMAYYLYTNIYLNQNKYKEAGIYFNKILKIATRARYSPQNKSTFLFTAIRYYIATKQYAPARKYLLEQSQMLEENFNLPDKTKNEEFLFMVDSASANYLSAIGHYQQYHRFKDSIFSVDKLKQVKALSVKFQTEEKDKNIKLLKQQDKLQKEKIHSDSVMRYVLIGSLILLILFICLLYNRYWLKQRTNKELKLQQQQIYEQNELLKKFLAEKEWLLKEIHHRVKNNLQIVISLLNTQSAYLDNKDALLAIQNSQHRMHAMSLIHQKLYQSDNLATIDMSWYIYELVNYLKECFDMDRRISYKLDTERVDLDVAQAVPLGLILNEAISNAIKYAFPEQQKGQILISLKKIADSSYQLIIADDGVGLPADFELENRESLGMNLMVGLSDQVDGTFNVENNNGLTVTITFTKKQQLMDTANSPQTIDEIN